MGQLTRYITWYLQVEGDEGDHVDESHAPKEQAAWQSNVAHVCCVEALSGISSLSVSAGRDSSLLLWNGKSVWDFHITWRQVPIGGSKWWHWGKGVGMGSHQLCLHTLDFPGALVWSHCTSIWSWHFRHSNILEAIEMHSMSFLPRFILQTPYYTYTWWAKHIKQT
jgi:hypothetical protein